MNFQAHIVFSCRCTEMEDTHVNMCKLYLCSEDLNTGTHTYMSSAFVN